ncbi:MAG TPA: S8 family serine peptidase [Jiangellaceae bacterium]
MGLRRRRSAGLPLVGLTAMSLVAGMTMTTVPAQATEPVAEPEPAEQKVQPDLAETFETEAEADFWVRLGERADFGTARQINDWAERGTAVADSLKQAAASSQRGVLDVLDRAGADHEAFWITNAVYVHDGSAELAERLAGLPEVEGVYQPVGYEMVEPEPADTMDQLQAVEWGIAAINADQVWNDFGVRGEGIVVASIDTGVQFDHPALVDQYRGNNGDGTFDHNYNWFDAAGSCADAPCDHDTSFGHGTHTMGTMVGDDGATNHIGVAPEATWIAANGCCPSDAALIASGQWLLEPTDLNGENPDASKRPHIINNSWGSTVPSNDPFMEDVIEAWAAAGIFGMWANGNNGPGCDTSSSPGSRIVSYSTGGFDINGDVYTNSSRGTGQDGVIKPNISAPAVNVRSASPGDGYRNLTGTSMASPHVAGSVALLWSAAPAVHGNIEATRDLLNTTAIDTEDLTCGGTPENNNVWGEGKLDALALLQAAPVGDTGTLAGTVTDNASGEPIADATVTVTGVVDREVTTGSDGSYDVLLPVGDYQVTAAAFGYESATADASIAADETTTRDFGLEAVDSVTVSGAVTDGSGHGWPLYAHVVVDGTPVDTYTDPRTGQYSLTLPVNDTYTLNYEAEYPGYAGTSETVDVTDTDVTLDTQLEVRVNQCRSAPGYDLQQPQIAMVTSDPSAQFADYFAERGIQVDFFGGADIDQITGYDVVLWGYNTSFSIDGDEFLGFLDTTDAEGAGVLFLDHAFTSGNGIKTLSEYTGNPVSVTTSTGGSGQENLYEVTQEHPILDGYEVGDQIIHEPGLTAWVAWFDGYEGEGRQVIADLGRTGDGILGSGIGVHERENNRHVLMSIHSSSATRGPSDWSAESDAIFWNAISWSNPDEAIECVPVSGGLVLGHVDDANTGDGINGASVSSVGAPGESATSFATPDDPALDDGFYWLFSSLTGSQDFVASADNYADATQTVDVAGSAATEANFTLAAGRLEVDPAAVDAEVRFGDSAERTFTVTNTGTAPAEVGLIESGGGFEILGGPEPADSGPRRPTGDAGADIPTADPEPAPTGDQARELEALGNEQGLGTSGLEPGLSATPTLPGTAQNEVTITHSASQEIVSLNSVACAVTGTGLTRENGYLRHFALDDFDIDGDFDVTNVSFGIETINGPPHPVTVNLYTMVDPDGVFDYPNFDPIGTADVTLDPQDLTIVDVPVEGTAPAGSTLVVEVETPDMVDQGGGLFVGSNPDGETAPTYLRSDSCGVASPTPVEDLIPGQNMHWVLNVTGQVGGDLPWLGIDPTSATLQPGESTTVTVSMDSSATEEQQPGAYTGAIAVAHDTPYQVDPVGVTMNVTPPNNWGKITGTVTGINCDGENTGPVADAIVQIDGRKRDVTLSTGPEGRYAYWMPVNNNALTMIVAAAGHIPQTRDATIKAGMTVTEDFTLLAVCDTTLNRGEVRAL